MYSPDNRLFDLVKRQYMFKLKAYDLFLGLLIVHGIAILLSYNGVGSMGFHSNDVTVNLTTYSNDLLLMLTMVWIFIAAAQMSAKKMRDSDFSFPSTRYSSVLSTEASLVTMAFIAGIATYVAGIALKVMVVLIKGDEIVSMAGFYLSAGEMAVGMIVTILYLLLAVSLGYATGMLIQWHKLFAFLLPIALLGNLYYVGQMDHIDKAFLTQAIAFFGTETSLGMFVIKIIVTSLALFAGSVLIANKLEVRR